MFPLLPFSWNNAGWVRGKKGGEGNHALFDHPVSEVSKRRGGKKKKRKRGGKDRPAEIPPFARRGGAKKKRERGDNDPDRCLVHASERREKKKKKKDRAALSLPLSRAAR